MDASLQHIAQKVSDQQRLSPEDGLNLMTHPDIWAVGRLANQVRHRLHGTTTYYNINRHINYSNICALSCKFCAFHRKKGDDGAYEFSPEHIADEARKAAQAGATEIHMVGGLHPYLPFSYYLDVLQAIKQAAPQIHIKAFTAVEVVHLSRIAKRPKDLLGVLTDLRDAGLGSLPGGGAEVFDDRVHDEAFKGKIRSDKWLEVHRAAHEAGLMSNATILYGHVESLEDRIHHFNLLREAQDDALERNLPGQFQTVIPLPFIPDDSELEHLPGPTGLEDLRMLAVARLMLDNIPHIKCFWIMQTLELAQVALDFGVDDVDGTVVWYDITKLSGASNHQEHSVRDLRDAITESGYAPVERDTIYRPVLRDGPNWRIEEPQPLSA